MANLQFFSMVDHRGRASVDPLDVAVVDFSRPGKAPATYLAAMLLNTTDGRGHISRVFAITEDEISTHFKPITAAEARTRNARIYAYALGVFAWQPNGKTS